MLGVKNLHFVVIPIPNIAFWNILFVKFQEKSLALDVDYHFWDYLHKN